MAKMNNDVTQQHIDTLVNKLLPLVTDALKVNNTVGKGSPTCVCKCSQQLTVLQKSHERMQSTVKGYKEQVEIWKGKLHTFQKDVNEINAERRKENKQVKTSVQTLNELQQKLSNKIEEYTKTHAVLKKALLEIEEKKKIFDIAPDLKITYNEVKTALSEFQEKTKALENAPSLDELKQSQDFINEAFEKMKKDIEKVAITISEGRNILQNQIQEVAQEVEYNKQHSSNNSQYTREEGLTVDGVSRDESVMDAHGNVDPTIDTCKESKKAVVDLCKELNLIIDPEKISIAHRLKKGKFAKAGPRRIIVKFSSKELCRDVLSLRKACKEISTWGFDKDASSIYINESLTPEKRRLLYLTKQGVKNKLKAQHGVIYVWTQKGDVYMRKSVIGAPKVRVNSELDLQNIVNGHVSLDVDNSSRSSLNMIRWRYVKDPWALNTASARSQRTSNL